VPGDEGGQQHREGVFSRFFYRPADEDNGGGTKHYSEDDLGVGGTGNFTIERAAEIIEELPKDVSRKSARKIVVQTLKATGIEIQDIIRSSQGREEELEAEIEQGEERIQELRHTTDEIIRSLRQEIDAAREKCEENVQAEQERIERIRASLLDLNRVRDFFGLEEEDHTQILSDPNRTERILMEDEDSAGGENRT
jgi:hypothetical protein